MASPIPMYRLTGTAGNVGMPGAPILYFDVLVNASTGVLSGHASIVQAVPPPLGNILIPNVTGRVTTMIFGGTVTHGVFMQGTYDQLIPAGPIIIQQSFSAYFSVDAQFNGRGCFKYADHDINDVPVVSYVTNESPSSGTASPASSSLPPELRRENLALPAAAAFPIQQTNPVTGYRTVLDLSGSSTNFLGWLQLMNGVQTAGFINLRQPTLPPSLGSGPPPYVVMDCPPDFLGTLLNLLQSNEPLEVRFFQASATAAPSAFLEHRN